MHQASKYYIGFQQSFCLPLVNASPLYKSIPNNIFPFFPVVVGGSQTTSSPYTTLDHRIRSHRIRISHTCQRPSRRYHPHQAPSLGEYLHPLVLSSSAVISATLTPLPEPAQCWPYNAFTHAGRNLFAIIISPVAFSSQLVCSTTLRIFSLVQLFMSYRTTQ